MTVSTVALGDAAVVLSGFAFKSELFSESEGMPLVRIRDVTRGHTKTYYTGPYSNDFLVEDGDILVGMDGNFEAARWRGGRALLNQRVCRIKGRPAVLDDAYMFHFLAPALKKIEDATPFVTVKHLSAGDVRGIQIPVPPLPEQRRIAAILDQANALRAKRREALAQLDSLTQSIFTEMFGDLDVNPKGFAVSLLGKLCDVRDGTHDSPKYVSDGYPLVTSKNLSEGRVDLTDVNLISKFDYDAINKRSKVDRGDLLMPMIGTIGNPVLIEQEPAYAVKNVAIVKFPPGSPSNVFIRAVLSGSYFDHIALRKNRGGTQKFLSLGDLRSIPVPLPPPSMQQAFATRIHAVESLRDTHHAALAESDALFASLQHRAFAGQLS